MAVAPVLHDPCIPLSVFYRQSSKNTTDLKFFAYYRLSVPVSVRTLQYYRKEPSVSYSPRRSQIVPPDKVVHVWSTHFCWQLPRIPIDLLSHAFISVGIVTTETYSLNVVSYYGDSISKSNRMLFIIVRVLRYVYNSKIAHSVINLLLYEALYTYRIVLLDSYLPDTPYNITPRVSRAQESRNAYDLDVSTPIY